MALISTAWSLSGIGSILATRFGPSLGFEPSTPAMKPVQKAPFSSSVKRPSSRMALTAAGTRQGVGFLL